MKFAVVFSGVLIISLLVTGGFLGNYVNSQWQTYVGELTVGAVDEEKTETLANMYLNDIDISNMTEADIVEVMTSYQNKILNQAITITIAGKTYETTLEAFDVEFSDDTDVLAKQLVSIGNDLTNLERVSNVDDETVYKFAYTYDYNKEKIKEFVTEIANDVYVEKVEPTFHMSSYGKFAVTDGSEGYYLDEDAVYDQILKSLKGVEDDVALEIERSVVKQKVDPALLKTVNKVVASYSSSYDPKIARATNVLRATELIDNTLLMPGDEFSFEDQISPVIRSNGYVDATIFLNGEATDGLGGGVCQISSTLYVTTLRAGILPTERRAHSLPVGYVPLGLDATMAENYIDYRFVNTFDYPLYVNAYAVDGKLTIEFWSNENAMGGMTYEPKSVVYPHGKGQAADTTLYGYNSNGKLVYEKFLDTSYYKPYAVASDND